MHPEHMERAISAAAHGSAVAIFAETLERAQDIAHEIEEAAPSQLLQRVSRLNGNHYLDFCGGGSIRFLSTHPNARSVRGMSLDRVFVPIGISRDILGDIIPSIVTSSEAVLTGY